MTKLRFIAVMALVSLLAFAPAKSWAVVDATASSEEAVHPSVTPAAAETDSATSEEPAAGEPAAEEHEGGLPQLKVQTYPSQIFWLMVMFGVLYLTFSKKILPNIGGVVNAREDMIRGNLETAESLKKQAEDIQKSYEKSLEQSRLKASQEIMSVEADAKKKANDQMESFRRKADGEMKKAEETVSAAKDKAMGEMASIAAEVASVAAEKITGIGTDMQKARAIVDSIASKAKAA